MVRGLQSHRNLYIVSYYSYTKLKNLILRPEAAEKIGVFIHMKIKVFLSFWNLDFCKVGGRWTIGWGVEPNRSLKQKNVHLRFLS